MSARVDDVSRRLDPSDRVEQYRKAAIWLIAAFGAVGAALATGIQVSRLGAVHDGQLAVAFCAAGVALIGIVLAIWHVGKVLEVHDVTTAEIKQSQELKDRMQAEPTVLGAFGHTSVDQLVDAYEGALRGYGEAQAASWANSEDAAATKLLKRRTEEWLELSQIEQHVRNIVLYAKVRAAYRRAQTWILAGAVLAFIGLVAFAWAANPPPQQPKPIRGERGPEGKEGREGKRGPPGFTGTAKWCVGGTISDPC